MRGLLAALAVALLLAAPAAASTRRVALEDGAVVALTDELEIFLEVAPAEGEGLLAFSRRFTGANEAAPTISALNGKPRRLLSGVRYRVPYELLLASWQLRAIQALFPADEARAEGWFHRVPEDGGGHNLWRIGLWFTGRGQTFRDLRELNDLGDENVPPGQGVLVPPELLLPVFRAALPPLASPVGTDYAYEREPSGDEYLVYHLKRGEALYSAVVVRFTGNTFANDVNALARELATLNGIRDVTDMPIGQKVRVPFDLLLPEFLPDGDPRRREYETNRAESAKYTNTVRSTTLAGITVILDAGHGGEDPGTNPDGVWESTYVYDIMLRVRHVLETRTAATVVSTTRDGERWEIVDRDRLPRSRGHAILTDPPYRIGDTTVGTHLRWYLANSIHRASLAKGKDPQKTVFLSIHADALLKTVRGAMAYIPAASLTQGEYGKAGTVYSERREVREKPRVDFAWKDRVQSEGLSRQLATHIIRSFQRRGLAVHPDKTIRDRVIRCRRCRAWVPAVVRHNAVPAKLLLEVCNLNNTEDRRLLQTREFRQQVAEAVVDGLLAYYGEEPPPPPVAAR